MPFLPSWGRKGGYAVSSKDDGLPVEVPAQAAQQIKEILTLRASGDTVLPAGGRAYGGTWSLQRAIKQAYENVTWVYKAVETIAGQTSRLPLGRAHYQGPDQDHGPVDYDFPAAELWNGRANPVEMGQHLRKRLAALYLLSPRGAFVEAVPATGSTTRVVEYRLLPSSRTRPVPDRDGNIDHYELVNVMGTERKKLDAERVRWFRNPHPEDPWRNMTPLEASGLTVELDYFARVSARSFAINDGRPGMLVAVEGELEDDEMERIERKFSPSGGPTGRGRTTVIAGKLTAADMSSTPREADYGATRLAGRDEILAGFGTPLSVIGDASGRCVDDQTEALTQRGWLHGAEITTTDRILSMDPADGQLKWSAVHEVYRARYTGPMYRLRHRHADFLVTPGHNWAVTPRPGQGRRTPSTTAAAVLRKVEDLARSDRIIAMGDAEASVVESAFSDAFVELVGWAVTEGHYQAGGAPYVRIRQNDGPKADRIERCLKEAGATFGRYQRDGRSLFNVRGETAAALVYVAPGKVMSMPFLVALTAGQRSILLQAMLDGDGCRQVSTASWTFAQRDRAATEAFVTLATLCGYTTSTRYREYTYRHKGAEERRGDWIAVVRQRKVMTVQRDTRTVEDYDGQVWCPRTDYGTFVARRNGRVIVTGNTFDNAEQELWNFWTITMPTYLGDLQYPWFDDVGSGYIAAHDLSKIDVLQRAARQREDRLLALWGQGLITVDEFRDETGRDPYDRPSSRALWIPGGKYAVPRDDDDLAWLSALSAETEPKPEPPPEPPVDDQAAALDAGQPPAEEPPLDADGLPADPAGMAQLADAVNAAFTQKSLQLAAKAAQAAADDVPHPQLEEAVAGVVADMVAAACDRLTLANVRKGTPYWDPPGQKRLDVDSVVQADRWIAAAEAAARPLLEQAVAGAVKAVDAAAGMETKAAKPPPPVDTRAAQAAVKAGLETVRAGVAAEAGRLRELLAAQTLTGAVALVAVVALAKRAADGLENAARHVGNRAGQVAAGDAAEQRATVLQKTAGLVVSRQWVTRKDGRVRPAHKAAEGQVRRPGAPFDVGGAKLRWPGDPQGPPEQTINCRCKTRYVRSRRTARTP